MKYWYEAKGKIQKKIFAAASLLLVSALLLGSVSYAWLSLSARPEVASVATNIASNGSLEIALGKDIRESAVGDSFDTSDATIANRTWGNLIDLTDKSYGLQSITLRPAMLNSAGGAVNTLHPFAHPVYGTDGRVETIYANDVFAAPYNGSRFVTAVNEYGVRGIGVADYSTLGHTGTFGPPSQRQEIYSYADSRLWRMTDNAYWGLCSYSLDALRAYYFNKTSISASYFNPDTLSEYLDEVIASANEELNLAFTLLAAAEATPAEHYFTAIKLLEAEDPSYEDVLPLVEASVRHMGAEEPGGAVAELRAFQNMALRLKAVLETGTIDGSDGYSMEEIEQTVGLVFDLEKSDCTVSNGYIYSYNIYSKADPELHYYHNNSHGHYSTSGFSIDNLTTSIYSNGFAQDSGDREYTADEMRSHLYPIYASLRLSDLDRAIADLYASHWSYWDREEYAQRNALDAQTRQIDREISSLRYSLSSVNSEINRLNSYISDPDISDEAKVSYRAQLATARSQKTNLQGQINDKTSELQAAADAVAAEELRLQPFTDSLAPKEYYAMDDSRLEVIRSVMADTIPALRRYTLWCIGYYSCSGNVPDNAYHRLQEILSVPGNADMHPRDAWNVLANYGVTLSADHPLMQMLTTCERLEQELPFLPRTPDSGEQVSWKALYAELKRVLGTITHEFFYFYTPESPETTIGVLARLREEIGRSEGSGSAQSYSQRINYAGTQPWEQALSLLNTFWNESDPFSYGKSEHTLVDRTFAISHIMDHYTDNFSFDISIGVGSEDNFNESGLTVRQTRFREAQENISYQQSLLITAAVDAEKEMVCLLMDMIAGQNSVSLTTISEYLSALQRQLRYADEMMYQAVLTLAASDYASDGFYNYAYYDYAPKDAADLIQELRWYYDVDETVLTALNQRMALLESQEALLDQSLARLRNYQDPQTGALTAEQISADEAADLLDPVLDTSAMFLYGYVKDPQSPKDSPSYLHTILYEGYGSPAVQISGRQAAIAGGEPVTLFGDAYLALGRSFSGALLALAKNQVETYAPPSGGLDAAGITELENGMNRKAYAMGSDKAMYTLELYTADTLYALPTNLWTYTGNTAYIAADNVLMDLYGYCVDLSLRTNAAASDLLLQTEAINRIYDEEETKTDTAMGAGSFMEFTTMHPSYSLDMAREYMSCIRVAITDTNTGYIYGYAALDMDAAEELGITIKAPLRLYHYDGTLVEGSQYLCHMDQNLEKNLTVYVYLDGAKTSEEIVSAYDKQSLYGVMNLQFASSADLNPAVMDKLR